MDPRIEGNFIPPGQDFRYGYGDNIRDMQSGRPISQGEQPAFGWNIHENGMATPATPFDASMRGYGPPMPGTPQFAAIAHQMERAQRRAAQAQPQKPAVAKPPKALPSPPLAPPVSPPKKRKPPYGRIIRYLCAAAAVFLLVYFVPAWHDRVFCPRKPTVEVASVAPSDLDHTTKEYLVGFRIHNRATVPITVLQAGFYTSDPSLPGNGHTYLGKYSQLRAPDTIAPFGDEKGFTVKARRSAYFTHTITGNGTSQPSVTIVLDQTDASTGERVAWWKWAADVRDSCQP